jgi:enoyl-CoA hydratase/carnithine racemase
MEASATDRQAEDELLVERRGALRWVTFNRPDARNAMTWNMYERLARVCEEVNQDSSVKALVFTGAGGEAFVSGTDISQFRSMTSERDFLDYERRGTTVLRTVESVRVPTIAAIAGACTGAGAAIANCCDLRIASPSARYGFPIARTLGNGLSMSNYARAMALLGMPRLKDLIFRARLMNATEMLSAGLVSEVTNDEASLLPRAQELAEELAGHAPLTLWVTKESLRRIRDRMVPPDDDSSLLLSVYMSSDFREGVEAFLEKRRPNWKGRG